MVDIAPAAVDTPPRTADLARRYECALREYLVRPDEAALAHAHEIGREALAHGLGLFHIAGAHARARSSLLTSARGEPPQADLFELLDRFLVEALSSFEMAHRGFWAANASLRRLNDVLEAQAKRIASALHDEAGQLLASVHLALADLSRTLPPAQAADISGVRELLDQIELRLRNLAHELRPPILEDLGLVGAVEFLSTGVAKRWHLPVSVESSIPQPLPAFVETALYRITQEALANIVKHARATRVEISLKAAARRVACSIRDNGVGFDLALAARTGACGLGLREIQERTAALGGSVRFVANQPSGTTLTVEIPFER